MNDNHDDDSSFKSGVAIGLIHKKHLNMHSIATRMLLEDELLNREIYSKNPFKRILQKLKIMKMDKLINPKEYIELMKSHINSHGER